MNVTSQIYNPPRRKRTHLVPKNENPGGTSNPSATVHEKRIFQLSEHPEAMLTTGSRRKYRPCVFVASRQYCAPQLCCSGNLPLASLQWTPSRFTIDGASYLFGEQCFDAEIRRSVGDHPASHLILLVPTESWANRMDAKYKVVMLRCGNTDRKKRFSVAHTRISPKRQPYDST